MLISRWWDISILICSGLHGDVLWKIFASFFLKATALVNVYGGTYTDSAYAFNVHDNCGSTTTIVLHEGIEYADFLKNGTTDVTKSDISAGRIAFADGCTLSEYDENGVAMNKVVKE